jgi:enamine deaminase RidA (YjgF/YER057c/UK114 family)
MENISHVGRPVLSLATSSSGTEIFVLLESLPEENFEAVAREVMARLKNTLVSKGSSLANLVRIRIYLSDMANQQSSMRKVIASHNLDCHIFLIELPPTSGSKIAFEAYAMSADKIGRKRLSDDGVEVKHGAYRSYWIQKSPGPSRSAHGQVEGMFSGLQQDLYVKGASIESSTLRTWIYLRDIDKDYQVMCDVRKAYFAGIGLTSDTHYIASTGIEGDTGSFERGYAMDSHSVLGLLPEQVVYINAPNNLCLTSEYSSERSYGRVGANVTFERGTQVIYGDRRHIYISGSASIDKDGKILHLEDVLRQAERILENIVALLQTANATMKDMHYLIVYIRDIADHQAVWSYLNDCLPPALPFIIVHGRVCNPGWLVEIEGFGVVIEKKPEYGSYF